MEDAEVFRFTITTAERDSGTLLPESSSLEELTEFLTVYTVGEKDGDALIPAVFNPCPPVCRNHAKAEAAKKKRAAGHSVRVPYDCGGDAPHRLAANVVQMTMFGIDIDGVSIETMDNITAALAARGLAFWAWNTHSHNPPADCRFRLLLPFAVPMPLTTAQQWSKVAWPALVKFLGLPFGTDLTCRNPDRIYFLPRKPNEAAERFAGFNPGAYLDWRPVVGDALRAMSSVVIPREGVAPEEDPERPVDLEEIRERMERINTSDRLLLQRVLKGCAPTPPPDERSPDEPSRYLAWRTVTNALALVADGWEDSDALLEVLRDAYSAEVKDSPQDHTDWSVIENLFESARGSAPAYKAQKKAEAAAWYELRRARLRRESRAPGDDEEPDPEPDPQVITPSPTQPDEIALGADEIEASKPPQVITSTRSYKTTDLGNAERMHDQHRAALRYVSAWGAWVSWDGCRWKRDELGRADQLGFKTVRSIYLEAAAATDPEESKNLSAWAYKSESGKSINSMMTLAKKLLAIDASKLDADPMALNVANGTLDLRTGKLRPHRQDDLITRLAPVVFDPSATCPTWDAFFERIFRRASTALRHFIQAAVGYTLTADVSEQVLFFAHGGGSNGKGTFVGTLQTMMGDYAKQGAPDLLLAKRGESHPAEQADLQGARLVSCSEVEQGRSFAEVAVKQLTGGDRIKARLMRQDFFEFAPTHKIFLSANHKPKVRGTDHAIWRRIKLIPFLEKITGAEKDPHLKDKLELELPGILAWSVRGTMAWVKDGLGEAPEVAQATQQYRHEQDRLATFLEESFEVDPDGRASNADIYRVYTVWCQRNGEQPWTQRALSDAMLEREMEPFRTGAGRGFKGIRLKTQTRGQAVGSSVIPVVQIVKGESNG